MNINEFAEQIVFGKTLEDKLMSPGKLTFDRRKSLNIDQIRSPGRSAGLAMQHGAGTGMQPPSDDRLGNEKSRGQLLHFLANHELLATELMALVLLKFPDAPRAFRQGVLVTLQEEQEHTRMYLQRMRECGIEFGSYPLSGQFWRVVEPMQSPMDFVSRLSLTFEQANLDYSLHFSGVFQKLGDLETSKLLNKIYQDEIGHVQHGLHWFRQWKNPEQSDWEAYRDSLEFPMSPQRGRGPRASFNREGRLAAGLTESFIDSIEVFRLSRGRAPSIRWFDPALEVELASELDTKSQRLMDQLGRDLEFVMVPLAKQDDIVLVRKAPSRELKKKLIDAGFELPELMPMTKLDTLSSRKIHDCSPWGWSPTNAQKATPLLGSIRHLPPVWTEQRSELFRKSFSQRFYANALGDQPSWFAGSHCVGKEVNQIDDVKSALSEFAQRGFASAIFKKDLSASGRGQRRLNCQSPLLQQDLNWLESAFRSNKSERPIAFLEPELKRLVDLSFLWHQPVVNAPALFQGWTRQLIAPGRRYVGSRLGTPFRDCEERIKRFLLPDRCIRLRQVADWIEDRLFPELISRDFRGSFGVDAFVFEDLSGELAIKPMVELNPRFTMGHVALRLSKRIAPGVPADFRIFSRSEWLGISSQLEESELIQSNDGHWKSGVIVLSDVQADTKLVPCVLVGREWVKKFDARNRL